MYERTAQEYNLDPQEVEILVGLFDNLNQEARLLRAFLEKHLQGHRDRLESKLEMATIYHSQGAIKGLKDYFGELEIIAKAARKEKEG